MAFGLPHISFIGYPTPIPCAGHAGLGFREAASRDLSPITEHYSRLSPEDRALRFCATLSDAALDTHAARTFERADLVIAGHDGPIWRGPFHDVGPIRALAELSVAGRNAEIGLSVDGTLRRRGVGTYLVQTAARLLAPRGVQRIHAYTLNRNHAMIRLGAASGAAIDIAGGDVEIAFDVDTLHRAYIRRRIAAQVFYPRA
jgi:RimJ/RimL family protein N-acetyltransferase